MDAELDICRAKFILNAIKDGWSVSMNQQGELEFTKAKEDIMHRKDYSKLFLQKYGLLGSKGI